MGGYGYGGGMPYAGMYGGATVDMDPRCPTMFSQCYLPVGNFSTTISYKVITTERFNTLSNDMSPFVWLIA